MGHNRALTAALQRHAVSSTATLLVPATARTLPASNALQARAKDDYDYDDDDYDDDYDYYGTRKKKKKPAGGAQAAAVSPSETNVFNFVRIMVLRLVWGFASWFGWDEPLSEAFGGAFVPPGVDPDGDDDLGFDY
ncbi:uncharacterized protein LOC117642962 [Thrips palmi]|uniref:Uncharacterized protein LOC117642962 n=1 Tax=Thrips palmi TaxID=161013 RepID=A0A6P8YKD0_THRPL|nr:uncharacterized protein LOC117642962 [Thrips palmi]